MCYALKKARQHQYKDTLSRLYANKDTYFSVFLQRVYRLRFAYFCNANFTLKVEMKANSNCTVSLTPLGQKGLQTIETNRIESHIESKPKQIEANQIELKLKLIQFRLVSLFLSCFSYTRLDIKLRHWHGLNSTKHVQNGSSCAFSMSIRVGWVIENWLTNSKNNKKETATTRAIKWSWPLFSWLCQRKNPFSLLSTIRASSSLLTIILEIYVYSVWYGILYNTLATFLRSTQFAAVYLLWPVAMKLAKNQNLAEWFLLCVCGNTGFNHIELKVWESGWDWMIARLCDWYAIDFG